MSTYSAGSVNSGTSRETLDSNHSYMKTKILELKKRNSLDREMVGLSTSNSEANDPTLPRAVKSQALKVYEQSKFRRAIAHAKHVQDAHDATTIINKRQDSQISVAVRDMARCPSLPLLVDDPTSERLPHEESITSEISLKSNNTLPSFISESGANFKPLDEGSSIYQTLVGVRRKVGPQTEGDLEYAAMQKERGIKADASPESKLKLKREGKYKPGDKNSLLIKATEMIYDASKMVDPTRLLFEAACIFDEMDIMEKATKYFEKCTLRCDPAAVVDSYDLTEDEGYERKLERMADSHRDQFLKERSRLRVHLIYAEEERQRLRNMVSRCQLVRLYLLQDDFPSAHNHLVKAFQLTISPAEHSELLCYAHSVLKEYSLKCFGEYRKDQQLVRGSAGPLAEAHLNILFELLEEDARNADVLEWLGRRYAEKCDFNRSFHYYKRAADMRAPVKTTIESRDSYLTREKEFDEEEFSASVNKAERLRFGMGLDEDEKARTDRAMSGTYAWPEGMHKGTTVILYTAPPQGWTYGSRMQLERQEQLGYAKKLPPRALRKKGKD